jgi:hypothetical protein
MRQANQTSGTTGVCYSCNKLQKPAECRTQVIRAPRFLCRRGKIHKMCSLKEISKWSIALNSIRSRTHIGPRAAKHANHQVRNFIYYTDRHIELDGDSHGPEGRELLNDLIANSPYRRERALKAACSSIKARIGLWNGTLSKLTDLRKSEAAQHGVSRALIDDDCEGCEGGLQEHCTIRHTAHAPRLRRWRRPPRSSRSLPSG